MPFSLVSAEDLGVSNLRGRIPVTTSPSCPARNGVASSCGLTQIFLVLEADHINLFVVLFLLCRGLDRLFEGLLSAFDRSRF